MTGRLDLSLSTLDTHVVYFDSSNGGREGGKHGQIAGNLRKRGLWKKYEKSPKAPIRNVPITHDFTKKTQEKERRDKSGVNLCTEFEHQHGTATSKDTKKRQLKEQI